MLNHSFYNTLSKEQRKTPQVLFVGQNISSTYMKDLMDVLEGKDSLLTLFPNQVQQQSLH